MKHHTHSPGRAFLTDRRAFGTALAAAFFTIMGLGAVALIGDHNHLTYQRDLLKSAARLGQPWPPSPTWPASVTA